MTNFPSDSASFNASIHYGNYANNQFDRGREDERKHVMICNYCKKPSHPMSKCYKLHGFPNKPSPSTSRFPKGKYFKKVAAMGQGGCQMIFRILFLIIRVSNLPVLVEIDNLLWLVYLLSRSVS